MLNIIICDDDQFTLSTTSKLLEKAIGISNVSAKIACLASSGKELLNFIQNHSCSYLYFLDFDFGRFELNGIDLVKRIYKSDPLGKIVFVTSHADKGMDILRSGIQAFGFIEKSPEPNKMVTEYTKYLKMLEPSDSPDTVMPSIELPIGIDETVTLSVSEIAFVDSVKTIAHSICYHTFDGSEVTIRDTMEHALELLGSDFIRCHRSVLVNKNHVVSLKNGLIKLANGNSVPCAVGKRKEILSVCFAGRNGND